MKLSNTIRVVAETEDEIEGENDDFLINNEITGEDQLMDQLEQNGAGYRQVCVGVGIWAQIPGKVFILWILSISFFFSFFSLSFG